jgi:hypothetical protein
MSWGDLNKRQEHETEIVSLESVVCDSTHACEQPEALCAGYSVMITPSLAMPMRLAYFKTIVGDFQLPPDCTRSTGVALPSAS